MLGNANNGANAGSLYLNGNNAVSDANANRGAFLNDTYKRLKGSEPDPMVEHHTDGSEPRSPFRASGIPAGRFRRPPSFPPDTDQDPAKTPF